MAISGQTVVATAGTEVVLGSQDINGPLMVKALDTNMGVVAVGNVGGNVVSVSTGMRLSAGEVLVFEWVGNLGSIMIDSAVNGDGVSWISLNV